MSVPSGPAKPSPQIPAAPAAALVPGPRMMPAMPIGNMGVSVAVDGQTGGGAVTARQAGGLIDMKLPVSPVQVPVPIALQNIAKAVNVAFQTHYGENQLEAVYQAAIVRKTDVIVFHKEYFGYGAGALAQVGMFFKSLQLSLKGPDPASPEGQKLIAEAKPRTLRGLLNLLGRKLDIIPEFEDKVPYYVQQMFDRLEACGIIVGWRREEWTIRTTSVGLNIRISPNLPAS